MSNQLQEKNIANEGSIPTNKKQTHQQETQNLNGHMGRDGLLIYL